MSTEPQSGPEAAVALNRLVLPLAQTLYNVALDAYCSAQYVRRHDDWTWDTQEPSRQSAWMAVAEYVLRQNAADHRPPPETKL